MTSQLTRIETALTALQTDIIELQMRIDILLGPQTYVVDMDSPNQNTADGLLKKISGKKRPGELIRLTHDEFALYASMLPCPPRNP